MIKIRGDKMKKDKYPRTIRLENGISLQIHREHFNQYSIFVFNGFGEQIQKFFCGV